MEESKFVMGGGNFCCIRSLICSFRTTASRRAPCLNVAVIQPTGCYEQLFRHASEALLGNIVQLVSGPHVAAGRGHFAGLWTRDFCFAARGLLDLGREDVVANHLSTLLRHQRAWDGLVPRLMDSVSPGYMRVVLHRASRYVPRFSRRLEMVEPLIAEYRSENGTEAVDSNILLLSTALAYVDRTGNTAWWERHEPALVHAYRYYDRLMRDELIVQPAFSDWQDSVSRAGKAFYVNLLYSLVTERLVGRAAFAVDAHRAARLRSKLEQTFFDSETGLYRSLEAGRHFSLEGVLLALDGAWVTGADAVALYRALTQHPLWSRHGMPGTCTVPDYPRRWISAQTALVGLRHYHDRLRWSWLIALAAKVATKLGDVAEARRILGQLEAWVIRDGALCEVYSSEPPHQPWRSRWFASERHFSWGAGVTLEALTTLSRLTARGPLQN